jgi:multidrug transporter EmrE-like cation transporter
MNVKNLQRAKYVAWGLACVAIFPLFVSNEKHNFLTAASFILIIAGIIFSYLHDKKQKIS